MKPNKPNLLITATLLLLSFFQQFSATGQACTPAGDQTTYGTGNIWRGYVYSGVNFNTYRGFVTAGTAGSYNFDQNFGGSSVSYATNGCPVTTDLFSVRYKLTKTFTNQNIDFTVSGDDGFRLSIDGGATWLINRWSDQSYVSSTASIYMNGTYNLVLEYYENSGDNRITFSAIAACTGTGNPNTYGTNNIWQAYIYQGQNFNLYKGSKTEGTTMDANFDEGFGGDNVSMNFLNCPINTENFSARFRLTRNMPAATYVFTVGGDDGYRLSLDGGATWVIDKWINQSYNVTSYTATLSGIRNMVLEYYENSGNNRITFTMSASILPVKLTAFNAVVTATKQVQLNWKAQSEVNFSRYIVQRSNDGTAFTDIATLVAKETNQLVNNYSHVDKPNTGGTYYYRLLMKDIDGSATYSASVKVDFNKPAETRLYPTIVTNRSINFESAVDISKATIGLFELNGKKLFSTNITIHKGTQIIGLEKLNNLRGSFVIRISGDQATSVSKIIIVQ